jgi:cell division protein FtsB
MRLVASMLFFLLILLQAKLWFGGHGIFQLWSLQGNIEQSSERNQSLIRRNDTLHAEVNELKQGSEALEERARSQLGFIKQGETFYRVVPGRSKATPNSTSD